VFLLYIKKGLAVQICHFYLLRHGKVEGAPALNGHTNCNTCPDLQQKIRKALTKKKLPFDQIISSPLKRCADLATLLQLDYPQATHTFNTQIKEMSFGELDGQPFETIKGQWPLLDAFWQDPFKNTLPDAETLTAFHQRIHSAWNHITQTNNANTLIITHGGVIRMILAMALNVDWKNPVWHANLAIGNASLTHIQISKTDQYYISVKNIAADLLE